MKSQTPVRPGVLAAVAAAVAVPAGGAPHLVSAWDETALEKLRPLWQGGTTQSGPVPVPATTCPLLLRWC